MKKNTHIQKYFPYIILLIVTIVIGFPLLKSKMLNGHDAIFHLFRTYTLKVAWKDHQIIPIVNPNMMGGLGYAPNLFYGILSAYLVYFLSYFIHPFGQAVNFLILLTIFFSGFTMYLWMKEITNQKKIALLASILYMTAPYHLFDIYVRLALGEILSFVFIPLVFLGMDSILRKDQKKWYCLTIGTAGLLLSHHLSAVMVGIFAFFSLCISWKQWKNKQIIKKLGMSLFLAIMISLPTIIPLLEAKVSSNYMVFDSEYMKTTGTNMENNAISLFSLSSDYPVRMVQGYSIILIFITAFWWLKKRKNPDTKIPVSFLVLTFLSIFFTLDFISWHYLLDCFSIFQFPWRYLQMTTFFFSIVVSLFYQQLTPKNAHFLYYGIIGISILGSFYFVNIGIQNKGLNLSLLSSNEIKKRGEIARATGTASAEYLPYQAIYSYDYLKNRESIPLLLAGNATIEHVKKEGTHLSFDINASNTVTVELPYIYYPGYLVTSSKETIPTFETKNGLVGISLKKGNYQITSYYRGTNLMIISYGLSFLSSLTLFILIRKKSRNKV